MRAAILLVAFLLTAVPARAQDIPYRHSHTESMRRVEDNHNRAAPPRMPAAKPDPAQTYTPSLGISVITPSEPGASLNGSTFVTGTALRVGLQWSF